MLLEMGVVVSFCSNKVKRLVKLNRVVNSGASVEYCGDGCQKPYGVCN